jgi:very-short-patch-repair endonuclease
MRLYAQNPEVLYGPREAVQRALRRVLAYNLYRDLARGWRLTSPNLEQCGLLTIEYHDLARFCAEAEIWSECHPSLHAAAPALRQTICEVLLNNLRRELAIYTDALDPEKQEQIRLDAGAQLIDPWCFGEADRLVQSVIAIPGSSAKTRGKRTGGRFYHISARSGFGQYLRRSTVLGAFGKLNLQDTEEIIRQLFRALTKLGALHEHPAGPRGGGQAGYQVAAASMIWRRGDGKEAVHDPIRVPSAPSRGLRPNPFFNDFYRADARDLAAFEAREHTAQVRADERERREDRFRRAELPLLFCSPTMELGVDIAELNVVNMRNVPPTPANYAQRSGRAGRSGQPAFVFTYCSAQSPHDQHFFTHPERMVAGEVTPPRLDLQNEDLLRAHVHAIWLAEAGLGLGSSLAALLDLVGDDPSLHPEPRVQAALTDPSAQARAFERARAALGDAITGLYPSDPAACDAWLAAVVEGVPSSFNRACGRWQTLYRAAHEQARRQHAVYGDRSRPQQEREQARRLLAEANAQLDLLAAPKAEFHSDFYSYRYFASEGFLPGYNFPRLPLSAYLPSARRRRGPDDEFLSRPRFLAVAEFGPRSIIYHEGSRFEINKVILGAEAEKRGPDGLCTRALRCGACGAIEPVSGPLAPDRCPACDALAGHIDQNLFRMRNVVARRRDRITSDEEERLRIGYDLRTNIHFPAVDGDRRRRTAALIDQDGAPLATLTYGHAANIWRINLGWRRRKDTDPPGFLLDTERGIWASKKDPEELDPEPDEPTTPQQQRVIPYVEDTRNSLLIDPAQPLGGAVMASLQAALKSAIQREFQIEDRELAAEPLPSRDDRRRLLFYEAAEGGAGVLRRLLEDKGAMSRVARQALTLCHFDPDTGKDLRRAAPEREECEAACYDCLLSYFNQPDHRSVDRQLLPQLLLSWSKGQVEHSASPTAADAGDHRATLLAACDSDLERRFLDHLHHRGHRLPNRAQVFIAAADTRVDFLYTPDPGSQVAIYVDGPHHDTPDVHRRDLQQQELLEDAGYLVLRFHHAADWSAIIAAYPSTFGAAPTPAPTPPARPATRLLDPPLDPPPDPLLELLDLFDDLWRPLIRQLAALPGLSVDAGEDLGDRVAASTIARLDRDDRSLFLIDAADPRAPTAHQHLAARRRRGLNVRPDTPVAAILAALDGPR